MGRVGMCFVLELVYLLQIHRVRGKTVFPAACTVNHFTNPESTEEERTGKDLVDKQKDFHSSCKNSCLTEVVRNVVRQRCSPFTKIKSVDYAVYRCPKKDAQYYVMTYDRCYLKHYTLCDEELTPDDDNLMNHVSDLFCGCEDVKPDVNTKKCNKNEHSTYLYCKVHTRSIDPRIARRPKCSGLCKYDHDMKNKTICSITDENNRPIYGKYCATTKDRIFTSREKFVKTSRLCDGDFDCSDDGDRIDEHNCTTFFENSPGLYCDKKSMIPEHYVIDRNKCNGRINCNDKKEIADNPEYEEGLDESYEMCKDSFCYDINTKKLIKITIDMMCDGKPDCMDSKDENGKYCHTNRQMPLDDGAPCDDNTRWITQKNLCSRSLCADGMDMDKERWKCDEHELCPSTPGGTDQILCNSTWYCNVVTPMSANCNYCSGGGPNEVSRCKDSENGIVCDKLSIYTPTYDYEERFIASNYFCSGNNICRNGTDNKGCENGYYCGENFIPWKDICRAASLDQARCDDKSDVTGCTNTPFFDEIIRNSGNVYTHRDLFNQALIENNTDTSTAVFSYDKLAEHRIFTCDNHLLNTTGNKQKLIDNVTEALCLPVEKFSCKRKYTTMYPLSNRIHRDWLCDDIQDCLDGRDEDMSVVSRCFRTNKRCYTSSMRCDGFDDCGDQSDEVGCTKKGLKCRDEHLLNFTTEKKMYEKLVEDAYICDGYNDCLNGMDERICKTKIAEEVHEKQTVGEKATLYNILHIKQEDSREGFRINVNQKKYTKPEDGECSVLKGGPYITAILNTAPGGGTGSWCKDNITYNTEHFKLINSDWYTQTYNDKNFDERCEGTKVFYPELVAGAMQYTTYVKFTKDSDYLDGSFYCKNSAKRKEPGACGIPLDRMCNFENDCGDWSDEHDDICKNNFLCRNTDKSTAKAIHISKKCDGISNCVGAQDECIVDCNKDILTNTNKILGTPVLLGIVWIFGIVSLIFNFYVIITMARSAFQVLNSIPHRFIYRMLVTTIAIGDIFVSLYLVILAGVDTFRSERYCQVKEEWLTGVTCTTMGVISTLGNHVSIFAMVTLSLFRLKTVVHYLWPRTVNSTKAIRISAILISVIFVTALFLSVMPTFDGLKDVFVDRYYFPARTGSDLFGKGDKKGVTYTIQAYLDVLEPGQHPDLTAFNNTIDSTRTWDDIFAVTSYMFENSDLITTKRRYNIYSSHGVCLFNYLGLNGDVSFSYVIMIIVINLVCFLTIIVTYVVIWKRGIQSKSTEKKLQKKLSIAIALCILCRVPLFLLCIYHAIHGSIQSERETSGSSVTSYRILSVFIIPINSVINPFINSEPSILDLIFKKTKQVAERTMTMSHALNNVTVNPTATTNTQL